MNKVEGLVTTITTTTGNALLNTGGHEDGVVRAPGLATRASASDDNGVIVIANSSSEEDNEDCSNDLKNVQMDSQTSPAEKKIFKRQPEEQGGGEGEEQQQQHENGHVFPHHLKVLLVEDDDSTRHVVAALLRNCGYEVTPAASGVRAWEILEGRESPVDLVLTDLMMPRMSGLELLKKISSRAAPSKRIPVVMMSNVDSMDVVLKCLSEGAVDFLVKPVRKNELKNLWQHFWRMCLSSSGSGSQTKVAGNNSGSYGGMNVGDGSDNGSGTQSSWTKKPVEVQSHEGIAAAATAQAHADSLLLNHNRDKAIEQAPPLLKAKGKEKDNHASTSNGDGAEPSCKDLLGTIQNQVQERNDKDCRAVPSDNDSTLELSLKRSRVKGDNDVEGELKGILHHSGGSAFSRYSNNPPPPQLPAAHNWLSAGASAAAAAAGDRLQVTEQGAACGANESLKDPKAEMAHYKLAASSIAAFNDIAAAYAQSLHQFFYHGSTPWPPPGGAPAADRGEKCPATHHHHHHHHHRHEPAEDELTVNNANANNMNINANTKNNNMNMGTSGNNNNLNFNGNNNNNNNNNNNGKGMLQHCISSNVPGKVAEVSNGSGGSSNLNGNGNGSVNGSVSGSNNLSNNNMQNKNNGNSNGTQSNNNNNIQNNNNSQSNNNMNSNGQSNGQSGTVGTAGNGDSGNNGSSKGNGTGITSAGNGNGNGNGNEAGIAPCPETNRLSRREVALHKFRQKRKERCFEKKVRYQSRKRLAEQRPRVRGQFVKQAACTAAADNPGDEDGAGNMEMEFEAEENATECVL